MGGRADAARMRRAVFAALAALTAWRLAALALSPLTLMFDEAQYWSWSRDLAFGYYSKPPLIAWTLAAAARACGEGEACLRAASPLLHLAAAAGCGLLARRLSGAAAGLAAALLYATLPGVAWSSMVASTDPLLLAFWAFGLFFLHRALESGRWRDWLAFGLCLGGGLLAKYTMILMLPCAALYLALAPGAARALSPRRAAAALAAAAAVAAPNLAWNAAHGFPTVTHLRDNANLGGALFRPRAFALFLASQFAVFGPVPFALFLWLAARMRRAAGDARTVFLLCFSAPVLALFLVQSLLSRAHANWAATAYIAGAVLVARWCLGAGARGRLLFAAAAALHLAAMPAIHHYDALAGERVALFDPMRRMRGWDALGAELSRLRAEHPGAVLLFDERKTMAQMLYYVRPHPFDAVKWNPRGGARDHYDLTTDIASAAGRPLLLVTERPDAAHVAPAFDAARRVATLEVRPHEGFALRRNVWRLDGFRGYPAGAAAR